MRASSPSPPHSPSPHGPASRARPTPRRRATPLRTAAALALLNARYCTRLAPSVRAELRRWERRANEIEDAELRALALSKLRDERFNAEAAAMLATLAPASSRPAVARAIVALELLYDYLDGLTERPLPDPLSDGAALYAAFTAAVVANPSATAVVPTTAAAPNALGVAPMSVAAPSADGPPPASDAYLAELTAVARAAIAQLPAHAAVAELAERCASLGGQAQVLMHASAAVGTEPLQAWARREAAQTGTPWREFLAGAASSVLALHALVVAAGDPATTRARAAELATLYTPICCAMTLLDGVVDSQRDAASGQRSYAQLYERPEQLAEALLHSARQCRRACASASDGAHHELVLLSALAYWLSTPHARATPLARMIERQLRSELGGSLTASLLMMRAWRAARRARGLARARTR